VEDDDDDDDDNSNNNNNNNFFVFGPQRLSVITLHYINAVKPVCLGGGGPQAIS
jgi:hypothetical protein